MRTSKSTVCGRVDGCRRSEGEPCYSAIIPPVAERGIRGLIFSSHRRKPDGTGIAQTVCDRHEDRRVMSMTKEKWLLIGAVIVGLVVVLYFLLLCPSDCH